jgi:hypothetical protein
MVTKIYVLFTTLTAGEFTNTLRMISDNEVTVRFLLQHGQLRSNIMKYAECVSRRFSFHSFNVELSLMRSKTFVMMVY